MPQNPAPLNADERAELEALRARVDQLERERREEIARALELVSQAQERVYWLDRWHVDLNAVMAKPGAAQVRRALRGVRGLRRAVVLLRRGLRHG